MEMKKEEWEFSELGETPWVLYTFPSLNPMWAEFKDRQFFYPLISPVHHNGFSKHVVRKRIPQLRNKIIFKCSQDCLILQEREQENIWSVFNPVTLQTVNLPPLTYASNDLDVEDGFLTSPIGCDDSVLVLQFSDTCIFVSRLDNPGWVTQTLQFEGVDVFTFNKLIYAATQDSNNPICYELDVSDSDSITVRVSQIPHPIRDVDFYLESCNHLYFIELLSNWEKVDWQFSVMHIYELDSDENIWREKSSLDGRAFFVGSKSCTWCWGNTSDPDLEGGILRNHVYITYDSVESEQPLYTYCLEDQTFSPVYPSSNVISWCCNPAVWFIPQHKRILSKSEEINEVEINQFQGLSLVESKTHDNLNETQQSSRFNELPLHMVELISNHMHLFEYWNFRATCKIFQSVCPAPEQTTNNTIPLFLFFKDNTGSCELVDPCRHNSRSGILQLSSDPFTVRYSKNGWLLILVASKSLQYYNFFTGERGEFPPLDDEDEDNLEFMSFAFSTNPTCPDCLVVAMVDNLDPDGVFFYYLEPGSKTWTACLCSEETQFSPVTSAPVFHSGSFYFLDSKGCLGAFRLEDGIPIWETLLRPDVVVLFHSFYLVECEGELYGVFMKLQGEWLRVFKFDDLGKNWVEITRLENRVLFISRASCFSIVTEDPKLKNRIYFPRLRGKDMDMVYYSQDTGKYHVLDGDDYLVNFYGTREPLSLRSCWV